MEIDRKKRLLSKVRNGPFEAVSLPPQNIELEQTVLGALLLTRLSLPIVLEFLRPEHFYSEAHKRIYQSILAIFQRGYPVDLRTVFAQLRQDGVSEMVGGASYLSELQAQVSSWENIEYHARLVVELAIKRNLIDVGHLLIKRGYEDTTDVFELLDQCEAEVFKIAAQNLRNQILHLRSVVTSVIKKTGEMATRSDGLTGILSGYTALDRITSGWQPSDLIILAARPGMGKSALANSLMVNAGKMNIPTAIFSLEMSALQVGQRATSALTDLPLDWIKDPRNNYNPEQVVRALTERSSRLFDIPVFIDDTPALSILEFRAKARRLKAEHGVQLIIVDYLQLMSGDRAGNREQEIASISRALKGVAKELSVPVIALSQLSRGVETRGGDKRPQLSDLRESGSIEQDADIVMFLYRPEYYKIEINEDGEPTQGLAELIIAKHRNGTTGTVKLRYLGKYTRFDDYDFSPTSSAEQRHTAPSRVNPSRADWVNPDLSQTNDDADDQPF
jgi:replicative DNA helicase